jgi:hypothetical protein
MESVELKCREIDNVQFPVFLAKNVASILRDPEMSVEVKTAEIADDVSKALSTLGYDVAPKKAMADWFVVKAIKGKK